MTKTKYYDLQMDDSQDNYDVEVVNANLKKIDEQMKTRENATDALQEPEFTVADKRENIASKEKISKILGKIAKFFTDLKKVAFTGDYADLTNKPTYGKGFVTDKSGTLSINLDGTTITLDEAKNVIKLADTLKDKIGSALQPESIVNNQITTEEGFALDARQANPSIDGTLAKQISDLNGSLNNVATQKDINALNPSGAIWSYVDKTLGKSAGWHRFAKIIYTSDVAAKGSTYTLIKTLIRQTFSNGLGCFHEIDFYLRYSDSARISTTGHGTNALKKVRIVRNNNVIFFDVYSDNVFNATEILLYIPLIEGIQSAEGIETYVVPEISDGEVVVCSVELTDNI